MYELPKYLNYKHNVIALVLGTAIFAETFILIFQPFGSGDWVSILGDNPFNLSDDFMYFCFSTLAVLVAMGTIAISRSVLYRIAKKRPIMIWEYITCVAAEVTAMALIYALFAIYILGLDCTFFEGWKQAILYTLCIILIPYLGFMLYFSLRDKDAQLSQLQKDLTVVETTNANTAEEILKFYDEKGELKISLRADTIYFVESADNYVLIYYITAEKLNKYMLRNTLKAIEENFSSKGLVRCHRSYIVNINKIRVLSKGSDGLEIDFGNEHLKKIPISKTYSKNLIERFSE